MKCPLLSRATQYPDEAIGIDAWDCLKEECAWWGTWTTEKSEEESGCCLPVLTSILSEIMNKMPHEKQSRRR